MSSANLTPACELPRSNRPLSLIDGFLALLRTFQLIIHNLHLLRYMVIPLLINLALAPLVFWLIWHFTSAWLFGRLDSAEHAWWADALILSGKALLALAVTATSALIFLGLALALGAPFHSWLSERIEKDMLSERPDLICIPERTLWEDASLAVKDTLKRLILAFPAIILGFVLGFLPVVGPALASAFNMVCMALFLALDSFTYPLERRNTKMSKRMKWVLYHYRYALGFALPFFLIPCAFLLVPPLSAAAATREYCQLLLEETQTQSQNSTVNHKSED